jgi:3-phenylpropionate/trans-cinnamate dioxygenase ferredoxin subunit
MFRVATRPVPSHQRKQSMSDPAVSWLVVCGVEDIDEEDVLQFEHAGKIYAIYHTPSGFHATDGICTHENARLADGLVIGEIIECPRHQGRFHIPTGKAKGAPACINLQTYPIKVEAGRIQIGLPTIPI